MYRIIASCYNHDIWTTICYCDFFLHYMTQQVLQFETLQFTSPIYYVLYAGGLCSHLGMVNVFLSNFPCDAGELKIIIFK